MALPAGIARTHVEQAIEQLDRGVSHAFGSSVDYDLLFKGRRYPPKAVLGLAASIASGQQIGPHDFSGGEGVGQANAVLRALGFDVVKRSHTTGESDARASAIRRLGPDATRVYEAAAVFKEQALQHDGSLFSPGTAIWTASTIADLDTRFVKRPDTSSDSFEVKFHRQLSDAPDHTVQLAAELLYVHLLITMQLRGQKKRDLIEGVLALAQTRVHIPESLARTLDVGLVNAGLAFLQRRPFLLAYLVQFAATWKASDDETRTRALTDPWAFKRAVMGVQMPGVGTQQHALLHLVYPDTFEAIVSERHKTLIVTAFRQYVHPGRDDVDQELLDIRAALSHQYGDAFDFYQRDIKMQWLPEVEATPEPDAPVVEKGPRVWVEKSLVADRIDRQQGAHALGKALWSPQRSEDGRDYYRTMREVKAGDIVLHFIDNRAFTGVSRAESAADSSFTGVAGTTWGNRPGYRIPLTDFVPLDPSLTREQLFQEPDARRRMQAIVAAHRGLFYNRNMELNQGAYLTEAPPALVNLLNEVYQRGAGRPLPYVTAEPSSGAASMSAVTRAPTLTWLAEQTLWPEERLQEVVDVLMSDTPQVILAGPPGTGKTWIAKLIAHFLTAGDKERQRLVQFHPSYTYETFMEAYAQSPSAGRFSSVASQVSCRRWWRRSAFERTGTYWSSTK